MSLCVGQLKYQYTNIGEQLIFCIITNLLKRVSCRGQTQCMEATASHLLSVCRFKWLALAKEACTNLGKVILFIEFEHHFFCQKMPLKDR